MNTLHTIPPRADVRYGVVQGKIEVFYSAGIEKAEAERFLQYLVGMLGNVPSERTFTLARRGDVVEVHMVVQKELIQDRGIQIGLRQDAKSFSLNVFLARPGRNASLWSEHLNVIQVLAVTNGPASFESDDHVHRRIDGLPRRRL